MNTCPVCRVSVLTPLSIATWRGQDVCCWCLPELHSHDAEDARRAIREFPMRRVTLTLASPDDA